MQTWACLLPMAFSQDSTSFQPSGLLAKILACLRWPLAQLASKVSLDTSIPTIESLTTCYHDRGWTQQSSAADHLVRGISGLPRPWIPSGINSGARRSGAISRVRVLSPKGGKRLTAFLAAQRDIVTRRTSCNVQGRVPAPDPLAKASARQRSNVATLIPTSRDTCSTAELSGGNSLATIRSSYPCPYRATF
jgi:hypothetical protein